MRPLPAEMIPIRLKRWICHSNCTLHIARSARASSLLLSLVMSDVQHGRMPIHLAALMGNADVLEQLCASKSPLDAPDDDGLVPLYKALRHKRVRAARILLAHNADLTKAMQVGIRDTHELKVRALAHTPILNTPSLQAVGKRFRLYTSIATLLEQHGQLASARLVLEMGTKVCPHLLLC